jgi:hypothetical protein
VALAVDHRFHRSTPATVRVRAAGPRGTGDRVVELLERTVGPEGEEAVGGAAAVDPRLVAEDGDDAGLGVAPGGVAESEQPVEERPQEGEPEGASPRS